MRVLPWVQMRLCVTDTKKHKKPVRPNLLPRSYMKKIHTILEICSDILQRLFQMFLSIPGNPSSIRKCHHITIISMIPHDVFIMDVQMRNITKIRHGICARGYWKKLFYKTFTYCASLFFSFTCISMVNRI